MTKEWKTKERLRIDAELRQEERNKRSAKEQIAELDRRLGVGVGATRERRRLNEQVALEGGK